MVAAQKVDSPCHLGQVGPGHRRIELMRVPGGPAEQMAGSLGGAVPGSSPSQITPSRTMLNPSLAMRWASAAVKFQGIPGSA